MTAAATSACLSLDVDSEQLRKNQEQLDGTKNTLERKDKLDRCLSGSTDQASSQNCVNAIRTRNSEAWGRTGIGSNPIGSILIRDIDR